MKHEQLNQNPADNRWEEMAKSVANADRQKRKIISAMLYDGNALGRHDAVLPNGAEQQYINAVRDGRITPAAEAALLATVAGPVEATQMQMQREQGTPAGLAHDIGLNRTFSNIAESRQEMRILGYMTEGDDGFNDTSKTRQGNVEAFLAKYPSPVEFEQARESFMGMMQKMQSPEKYAEYVDSMDKFAKHIYGKKQEYYEGMKELREKAMEEKTRQLIEPEEHSKTERINFDVPKAREIPRPEIPRPENLARMAKVEAIDRGLEKLEVRDVSFAKISKEQVRANGKKGFFEKIASTFTGDKLKDDGLSQDTELAMPEKGLFGVFDGAGGHEGGQAASQTAKRRIESLSNMPVRSPEDLAKMLNAADVAVHENQVAGYTTGVLAKACYDGNGRKAVMWASVGDSRLYLVTKTGEARQITQDEGYENVVTNALGANGDGNAVKQFGTFLVNPGDRLVLCSDGITGDKGKDLMNNQELAGLVRGRGGANEAAKRLIENARKIDDRTAVVIEI